VSLKHSTKTSGTFRCRLAVFAKSLAVLLVWSSLLLAANHRGTETYQDLEKRVKNTERILKDIQGELRIIITQSGVKREIEGRFLYLDGYGLRVEYDKPERQLMLLTEKELNIYFPKINQLLHDKPHSGARLYYLDLVHGFSGYFAEGRVKKVIKQDDDWQAEVRGRAGEDMIVYLRGKLALPYRITAKTRAGGTDVRFNDVEMNGGLKRGDMELKLPADVDIVELEGFSR
jgi:outer membrane lipoprotein-sorting protein